LGAKAVEDYAVATLTLDTGAVVRLACSWRLHAGEPAVIGAAFQGVEGGAALRNIGGSFYDFAADRLDGTTRRNPGHPAGRLGRSRGRRLGKPTGGGRPVRSGRRAPGRCRPGARPHLQR
jgi:predicted dehydrogenase